MDQKINNLCHPWNRNSTKNALLEIAGQLQQSIKRFYISCWHNLSLDPDNQKDVSWQDTLVVRRRRLFFVIIHSLAVLGLYYCITGKVMLHTIIFALLLGICASIGATAGAHRLWSHHAYKATWQLKLMLIVFQTLSVQYSVMYWARAHRLHHKFTDTDADPHNSSRGFYFCHIGWNFYLPHPQVDEKIKKIDVSDLEKDKFVMFQYKYYVVSVLIISYLLPTIVPWYFWNENIYFAHLVCAQLRHITTLHGTFLINSAAHLWGTKPYDKNINPTENLLVSAATFGDGWHNYHHVFPWDYKNSEFSHYALNVSTAFIDLFAAIGWAYHRKTVPSDLIAKRAQRTGDGSHHSSHSSNIWGWGDPDMPKEERNAIIS